MAMQARLKKLAEKEKIAADKQAEREEKIRKKELEKAERRTSTGSNKDRNNKKSRLARGTRAEISEDDPPCLKATKFPAIQSFGEVDGENYVQEAAEAFYWESPVIVRAPKGKRASALRPVLKALQPLSDVFVCVVT